MLCCFALLNRIVAARLRRLWALLYGR